MDPEIDWFTFSPQGGVRGTTGALRGGGERSRDVCNGMKGKVMAGGIPQPRGDGAPGPRRR